MEASHKLTEDGYETLREQARAVATTAFPPTLNSRGQAIPLRDAVRLSGIDHQSKTRAKAWKNSPLRRVDWKWSEGTAEYAWRHPKRFELAIWYRDTFLCGLALGRPTWSGHKLRLDFVELSPETTPLDAIVAHRHLPRFQNQIADNERLNAHTEQYRNFGITSKARENFVLRNIRKSNSAQRGKILRQHRTIRHTGQNA